MQGNLLPKKKARMRVLFITPLRPEQAGEAQYATDYALNLSRKLSHQIELLVLTKNGNRFDALNGLVADRLPRMPFTACFTTFLYLIKSAITYRPDLIHVTYGPNPYFGGRVGEPLTLFLLFARLRRIPTVITMHSMWLPEDIEERHRRTRFRVISAVAVLKRIYMGLIYGVLVRLSDRVLLLTSACGARHSDRFRHVYGLPDKLGEEVHGLEIVNTIRNKSADHNVMSFGFFRYDKGYHVLIHAFPKVIAKYRDASLLLIGRAETQGDQQYVGELARMIENLQLSSNVRLVSRFVDDRELQSYLDSASVFVFPYLRNIGASGSVHRAIGLLKPIVLTSIGYNAELDFALQVPRNNVEALSNAILRALTITDWQDTELGRKQERYAKSHSWDTVSESNFTIYQDLVKAKGRAI
jgi:glycosyltransferase involved in cell wall biosynthesis